MSHEKSLKNTGGTLLFLFGLSCLVLLFSSECSPLYPLNEWYDPNCFFTVGKAMLNGKVVYRDIYEQKGPYLYFLHAFCALIDNRSFIGVWIMEIAACFAMLLFVYKILRLYGIVDFKRIGIVCTLLCVSVYFSFASSTGDSVEEFCAPFLLGVVYLTLKRIKANAAFKFRDYVFIGLTAGGVLWSKFTVIAFFIAWYVFFLYYTIKSKRFGHIGFSVIFIALGVFLATLPPLFYFSVNHAVGDWLRAYIYDNLFLYGGGDNIFLRLGKIVLYVLATVGVNIQYNFFVILGIVWFAKRKNGASEAERIFLLLVPALTAVLLYAGGRGYRYYGLPLHIFSVFGYIAVLKSDRAFMKKRVAEFVIPAVTVCFCTLFFFINGNANYIFRVKEDTAQYKFAKIIQEKENATLLNYGFLDAGFYFAADKLPECKYFCKLNIPLSEMNEEMDRQVNEGLADFVVIRVGKRFPDELDCERYEEVMRVRETYSLQKFTYILYALK